METKDLTSVYENMYRPKAKLVQENTEIEDDSDDTSAKFTSKSRKRSKKRSLSNKDIGAIEQVNSSRSYDSSVFGRILKEMDETGSLDVDDDNVFDTEGDFGDDDLSIGGGGSAEDILRSIFDQLKDYFEGGDEDEFGEDEFEDEGGEFDFEGDIEEDDDIPLESYAFSGGEGNPKGAQGTYDGRARRQAKTTHVKDNGDAKVGQSQDTGYDPDDVEGHEGSEHGAQGNYDGRARALPKTNLVKGNGDADRGKSKPGFKTSSGKKDKNFF